MGLLGKTQEFLTAVAQRPGYRQYLWDKLGRQFGYVPLWLGFRLPHRLPAPIARSRHRRRETNSRTDSMRRQRRTLAPLPQNKINGEPAAEAKVVSSRHPAKERVLVCILGQTRAHRLTWSRFKKNVLDELQADLALCIAVDENYDYSNPFWKFARFRWISPEYEDFGDGFDHAQQILAGPDSVKLPDWRILLKIKDFWLGGVRGQEAHQGTGGIQIYFRWFLLHNLLENNLLTEYDRIVVTRSDHFWNIPHPPLSILPRKFIWVPDGEFSGGLTDRHLVVSSEDIPRVINLMDAVVLQPGRLFRQMSYHERWNAEKYAAFHLAKRGLHTRVRAFPYVMFLVRGPEDKTGWPAGSHFAGAFDEEVGMIVRYRSELDSARRYAHIRRREDWELIAAKEPLLFHPWRPMQAVAFHLAHGFRRLLPASGRGGVVSGF
jgi:hypothetical protein